MLQFTIPVKFKGTETKKGVSSKSGKPYEITEAKFFVPDLGIVSVAVNGSPKFPLQEQLVNLTLSVHQGSFMSLRVLFDEQSSFTVVK